MANPTIGHIDCPITGEKNCEVRRYATGKRKLYYVSGAGMITPNLIDGQKFMQENTRFIGDNGQALPAINDYQKPVAAPVNEPAPVNDEPKQPKPAAKRSQSPLEWLLSNDD